MKSNRVLFTFWDGGSAHLNRVMPIAQRMQALGWEVGFIASGKYELPVKSSPFPKRVYHVENRKASVHPPPYPFPVYSHAFKHAQRLKGLEFDDVRFIERVVEEERRVIRDFRPRLVVNDYRDTISISAGTEGVPVAGITTTNGHSAGLPLGWWTPPPPALILPDCRESFNLARERLGLPPIADERESFEGDVTLIPSIPRLDPLSGEGAPGKAVYVGMLNEITQPEKPPERLARIAERKHPLVVCYLGERRNPAWSPDRMFHDAALASSFTLAVAGDARSYPETHEAARRAPNLFAAERWELDEWSWLLRNASVLVTHGVTSSLAAASLGVPVVAIAWNTEPGTAYSICQTGAGVWVPHSLKPLERRSAPDLGEGVEIMGHWESEVTGRSLVDAVEAVLSDPSYSHGAGVLARELAELGGAETAVDALHAFLDLTGPEWPRG